MSTEAGQDHYPDEVKREKALVNLENMIGIEATVAAKASEEAFTKAVNDRLGELNKTNKIALGELASQEHLLKQKITLIDDKISAQNNLIAQNTRLTDTISERDKTNAPIDAEIKKFKSYISEEEKKISVFESRKDLAITGDVNALRKEVTRIRSYSHRTDLIMNPEKAALEGDNTWTNNVLIAHEKELRSKMKPGSSDPAIAYYTNEITLFYDTLIDKGPGKNISAWQNEINKLTKLKDDNYEAKTSPIIDEIHKNTAKSKAKIVALDHEIDALGEPSKAPDYDPMEEKLKNAANRITERNQMASNRIESTPDERITNTQQSGPTR